MKKLIKLILFILIIGGFITYKFLNSNFIGNMNKTADQSIKVYNNKENRNTYKQAYHPDKKSDLSLVIHKFKSLFDFRKYGYSIFPPSKLSICSCSSSHSVVTSDLIPENSMELLSHSSSQWYLGINHV